MRPEEFLLVLLWMSECINIVGEGKRRGQEKILHIKSNQMLVMTLVNGYFFVWKWSGGERDIRENAMAIDFPPITVTRRATLLKCHWVVIYKIICEYTHPLPKLHINFMASDALKRHFFGGSLPSKFENVSLVHLFPQFQFLPVFYSSLSLNGEHALHVLW